VKADEAEEAPWERSLTRAAVLDETDQMLEEAIRIIQREGDASASLLQRKLNVSYPAGAGGSSMHYTKSARWGSHRPGDELVSC